MLLRVLPNQGSTTGSSLLYRGPFLRTSTSVVVKQLLAGGRATDDDLRAVLQLVAHQLEEVRVQAAKELRAALADHERASASTSGLFCTSPVVHAVGSSPCRAGGSHHTFVCWTARDMTKVVVQACVAQLETESHPAVVRHLASVVALASKVGCVAWRLVRSNMLFTSVCLCLHYMDIAGTDHGAGMAR